MKRKKREPELVVSPAAVIENKVLKKVRAKGSSKRKKPVGNLKGISNDERVAISEDMKQIQYAGSASSSAKQKAKEKIRQSVVVPMRIQTTLLPETCDGKLRMSPSKQVVTLTPDTRANIKEARDKETNSLFQSSAREHDLNGEVVFFRKQSVVLKRELKHANGIAIAQGPVWECLAVGKLENDSVQWYFPDDLVMVKFPGNKNLVQAHIVGILYYSGIIRGKAVHFHVIVDGETVSRKVQPNQLEWKGRYEDLMGKKEQRKEMWRTILLTLTMQPEFRNTGDSVPSKTRVRIAKSEKLDIQISSTSASFIQQNESSMSEKDPETLFLEAQLLNAQAEAARVKAQLALRSNKKK